jgi:hypothetical protein
MTAARHDDDARLVEAPPPAARRALGLVAPPPPALRARQLLAEARKAAAEHLAALESAIATVRELAEAVAEGEALYGPGLTDFAGRLHEDLFWRSKTLAMLSQKQRGRIGALSNEP